MIEAIIAKVQQLLNRTGQSTDSAGSTGSLHAKTSDIRNQTGAIGDAASASGSLHAKVADVKGSLGNTNDAASSTGTVNAKLADVKSTLNTVNTNMATSTQATNIQNAVNALPVPMKPRGVKTTQATITSFSSATTVLNVSVPGRLLYIRCDSGANTGYGYNLNMTVSADGITLANNAVSNFGGGSSNSYYNPIGSSSQLIDIQFKSNLTISGCQLSGSQTTTGATPSITFTIIYETE